MFIFNMTYKIKAKNSRMSFNLADNIIFSAIIIFKSGKRKYLEYRNLY